VYTDNESSSWFGSAAAQTARWRKSTHYTCKKMILKSGYSIELAYKLSWATSNPAADIPSSITTTVINEATHRTQAKRI
jgi:hypothetical protein